jgi:hypothetical protein
MISCPAAKGIRWVKPAAYSISPSCTWLEIASAKGNNFDIDDLYNLQVITARVGGNGSWNLLGSYIALCTRVS